MRCVPSLSTGPLMVRNRICHPQTAPLGAFASLPRWSGLPRGQSELRRNLWFVLSCNEASAALQMLLEALDPYHVDSLLQLSDVCRMREDHEMARDFIGKS